MKSLNGQKPNQAQDAIISAVVVVILISVTVFLFYCADNRKNTVTQKAKPFSSVKKEMTGQLPAPPAATGTASAAKSSEEETPGIKKHNRDFVYQMPEGVLPPLPALDVRPLKQQVNADIGEIITTKRKSQIIVPPHAFLDGKGNVVQGNVDIRFREFHDFREIFLSGIPMKYDSAGVNDMLESAGMAELTASKDNQPVYVNPAAKIKMMLASAFKGTDYNLYYYDKQKNKWIYKGRDEAIATGGGRQPVDGNKQVVDGAGPSAQLTMGFRYNGPQYNVAMQCMSDMQNKRKHFYSKLKTPNVFAFKLVKCAELQPDLKELKGVIWAYYGDDAVSVFKQVFGTDVLKLNEIPVMEYKGWATVTQDEDRAFHLKLERGDGTIEIPVQPVGTTDYQANNFLRKWNRYTAARNQLKSDVRAAYVTFMKDTASYYATYGRTFADVAAGQQTVLRSFQVDGFGIWNCDRRFTPPAANEVLARFVDEKGNPLLFYTAYMVEKDKNSVYAMTDFQHFRFDPNSKNLFWAVLPGNKIAIVSPDEFARHSSTKTGACTFTARVSNTALQSNSNLQKELAFN